MLIRIFFFQKNSYSRKFNVIRSQFGKSWRGWKLLEISLSLLNENSHEIAWGFWVLCSWLYTLWNLLSFKSPSYTFFLLIVLLGPHFASGGDSLLGTNLFFNILLVQETISVGEENIYIYSKEIVLGLVTCRWSMRKELGKNKKLREGIFKCLVGISTTFTGCFSFYWCYLSKVVQKHRA